MTTPERSTPDPRDARITELEAHLARLRSQVAQVQQENADLRAQLTAALRAAKRQANPFARKKRNPNPKKAGRHPGQGRFTRRSPPTPSEVNLTHEVALDSCPSGYCAECQRRVRATHPQQISTATGAAGVVFGPRLKALAADLHHRLGLSYGKIADLFGELYGLPISRGGLAQADSRLAEAAKPIYEELVELVRQSMVAHVDETGWRIGPLSAWLWVFCNQEVTVYTVSTSRGHEVVLSILGREFRGVLVADCFKAYDAAALSDWLQQKCVAHLLRHLSEMEAANSWRALDFPRQVSALLREALELKTHAAAMASAEYDKATERLEERLDALIDERRRFTNPDNARMAKLLRLQRVHILRFLYWEEVDATNNLAERQLRPSVPIRKSGGCNRTAGGAAAHAILMSVLATCRQRRMKILDYLIKLQQFGATPPSLVPT